MGCFGVCADWDPAWCVAVAFEFDISSFTTIVAAVERPDGTAFERDSIVLTDHLVRFDWLATDWIPGCSQLTVRLEDSGGLPSHVPPVTFEVRQKPTAPTP